MGIQDYSTLAGANTTISSINIAEGCPPGNVNDAIRQEMADTRAQCEDAEWFNWGQTITYASATSFIVAATDVTGEYHAGRRVKAAGVATGTIYGTIASSAFVTGTTVTVTWDSGELSNESLEIYLGILRAENPSLPNSDAARTALGLDEVYPRLDSANTFAADQTLVSADAGATGPTLNLHHDSASPAADDTIGAINLKGNNDAAEETIYARLRAVLADATDAAEDGRISVDAMTAGTLTAVLHMAQGIWTPNATGGDPGADKINATEYQANGTALPFQKAYESGQQGITSGGTLTLAHSLGVQPKLYLVYLKCVSAEHGYQVGDETIILNLQGVDGGCNIVPDATNLNIQYGGGTAVFNVLNTSGTGVSATNSRWRAIFRAWA